MIRVYSTKGATTGRWSITGGHLRYIQAGGTLYVCWRDIFWAVYMRDGEVQAVKLLEPNDGPVDEIYTAIADVIKRCSLTATDAT